MHTCNTLLRPKQAGLFLAAARHADNMASTAEEDFPDPPPVVPGGPAWTGRRVWIDNTEAIPIYACMFVKTGGAFRIRDFEGMDAIRPLQAGL